MVFNIVRSPDIVSPALATLPAIAVVFELMFDVLVLMLLVFVDILLAFVVTSLSKAALIKVLTSVAVTPVDNEGVPERFKIAGSPVSGEAFVIVKFG